MSAKLQMALDHGKRDEVLRIVDGLDGHIDILEIGYPQMVTFGLEIVSEIHEAHPSLPICVDVKVFHGGSGITRRCFESGASIVTVLGSAPDPVIKKMVSHAHRYGGAIMCDLDNLKRPVRRAQEVDRLGVDFVSISTGFMMEHEYELYKRDHGSIFQTKPLALAGSVKRNLRNAGLALGTGINISNIAQVMTLNPAIVMVGRGIYEMADGAGGMKLAPFEERPRRADALRKAMA